VNAPPDGSPGPAFAVFEFGDFRIDLRRRLLLSRRDGQPLRMTARVFDTLAYFVEHPGQLLDRDALMDGIWPHADVENNNLSQSVSALRRILGEVPGQHQFIATVPGRGYRFLATVTPQIPAPPAAPAPKRPPVQADAETQQLYAQALRLMERPAPDTLQLGIERLQAALARSPDFAPGWCWLADARMFKINVGLGSIDDLVIAEGEARRALELDAEAAIALAVLGNINAHRGSWIDADACYTKAITIDSSDPMPRAMHASMVLHSVGHAARARRQLHEAFSLAPADPRMMLHLAMTHAIGGDDAAALHYADLAVKFGFPAGTAPLPLATSLAAQRAGRYTEAAEEVDRMLPPPLRATGVAALVYEALSEPDRKPHALAAIRAASEAMPDFVLCTGNLVMLFVGWSAQLGDLDLAYALAHRAIDRCAQRGALPPSWQTLWLPELEPMRQAGDFEGLARRLGFTEFWARFGQPQLSSVA
jgi:DNA-binding winged helix-turn-helix (wHTH) protein